MKRIIGIIWLIMIVITANAQPPLGINYQAVARNASGNLITSTNIGVKISVIDGTPGGIVQYSETHTTATNAFGLFNLVIGGGTPASGTFAAITWGSGNKYIKVEVDPAGGATYVNMGTFQVWSVPYALNALNSINDMDNQLLSLVGNNLTISNGNTVVLPNYLSAITTDATLTGDGTPVLPLKIAQQGATSGQTLKWNGSTWLPANDIDAQTLSLAGSDLTISNGNTITLPSGLGGSGTLNYIPKFTSSSAIGNSILFDNGGNIGIGTLTPSSRLHLYGTGMLDQKIENTNSMGSSTIFLKTNGGAWDNLELTKWAPLATGSMSGLPLENLATIITGANGGAMALGTLNNNSLYFIANDKVRMRIDSNGLVGIGTKPQPVTMLHIHQASATPYALTRYTSAATGTGFSDGFIVGMNTAAGDVNVWNFEQQPIRFGTYGSLRMQITGDGYVGIGSITPTYFFQATPASSVRHTSYFTNGYACGLLNTTTGLPLTGGTAAVIGDYTASGSNDGIGVYGRALNTTTMYGYGGYFEGNYIGLYGRGSTGGHTGIYAYANGATNAIVINGNMTGTGTNSYTSDMKLKKNIRPIEGALDKIMKMQPSLYEFKVGEFGTMELPNGDHYGLIAQDLQKIYPELVIENDFLGEGREGNFKYLGINYQELTPIVIKAIQEQQSVIQNQSQEIQWLKKKIEELESRIK